MKIVGINKYLTMQKPISEDQTNYQQKTLSVVAINEKQLSVLQNCGPHQPPARVCDVKTCIDNKM